MNKLTAVTACAVLLLTAPAFAQTTSAPGTPGMSEGSSGQQEKLTTGRITEVDLSNGTVTLDTGDQFTLSPALQYTSFPAVGEEVQVTYSEQGGQKVARIIDVGGTKSDGDSGS